ncbi:BCCT family transporter [Piscinibacter sakaiensis]|uniref:Glycine betaine transporter OpuD n=1 Tax=Piscinibacter sakaiensis TaxID=1547922 RepID=A0A0K8P0I6_PISS1|nr:BCCT family transporter [Piscinibacter sakaiensis]GAP36152.1 glycine betaine transporter OpuD [Piscinibacter sakaiensis]
MSLLLAAFFVVAVVAWGVWAPGSLAGLFDALLEATTGNLGWYYLWLVLGLVVFAFWLAFGRHGSLKLGASDEEPAFSTPAWFAMLFAAGMGIGLVFWGVAEPLSHYAAPPPGVAAGTPEAAHAAMRQSFFHWGLHPWAVYSVVALAIAFFSFRRGRPALVGSAASALPWRFAPRIGPVADALAMVATAFGVAASLGLGALQINSGLARLLGVPVGMPAQLAIIALTAALFIASAVSGIERGVKWLSSANLVLAGLLAVAVLALGPTVAIIDTFTTTLGGYASDFVRLSLRTTPFRDDRWVADWTIFYWAWWLSWAPFVGLFIARVSRGRTVREFIVGTMLAPTLAAMLWFSVFGGAALNLQILHGVPIGDAVSADVSTAMFALFDALPMSGLLASAATVLVLVFFVTSGDSATLVLAMLATRGQAEPRAGVKLLWGGLVAAIAASLLASGGLRALQTATIVFALPFSFVVVLMAVALARGVREDWERERDEERALRRRLRALAGSERADR